MRTIDKVRLDNAATLALETGFTVGWAPGSAQYLTKIEGWFGSAPMRRPGSELMNNHGNHAERGFKDVRLISVSGHYVATDRGDAVAKMDALNAYLGDGTRGVFQVEDATVGTRWVPVYLATGGLDVDWDGAVDVSFTIHLEATPRKYGGEVVSPATGIPTPGSGLVFPLFSSAPEATVTRINECKNPEPSTTTGWSGVGGVVTTFASGGAAYQSTASGAGTPYVFTAPSQAAIVTGETYTLSANIEVAAGSQVGRLTIRAHQKTGNIYFASGGLLTYDPRGLGKHRVSVTYTAIQDVPANELDMSFVMYTAAGGLLPAGEWLKVGQVLIEKAPTAGTYFHGSNPTVQVDPDTIRTYAWTGAANNSSSVETTTDYAGPGGALDLGRGGVSGKVSLTNTGTADTGVIFTVTGDYVPSFTITQEGTGRRLVYGEIVTTGQALTLDSTTGQVTLDGYAARETELTVAEWSRLGPGETGTWLFEAPGSINASMSAKVVQAWW